MRRRAETPTAFVRAVLDAYEKYGVSPERALAEARITRTQLERMDGHIHVEQMETLSATAMQELDDEALGWFSRRLPWGSYGMLCRASHGSPTLRVALKRWCRHHALLTDDVHLSLVEDRDGERLTIEERTDLGAMREFCLLTNLRYVHGYACWLVDSQLPLADVRFPFPSPPYAKVYGLLFPGPVHFDANARSRDGYRAATLVFEPGYLDLVPSRDDAAMRRMLAHALPVTARRYRRDRLIASRVRALLGDPKNPQTTAAALAKALHVSLRSLHRHLASEGASLQSLKDEVRQARAIHLLRRTDVPIKQLARMVGFENDKSFARAFKSWTGKSPSDYRP